MIARSIEGKGRFIEQIMDGVWSICEETFWGASAHLGNQKGGIGLPNVEDPIMDNAFNTLTQSFMTTSKIILKTPGKIALQLPGGEKFYLTYDDNVWEFKKEKIELTAPKTKCLKPNGKAGISGVFY